MYLNLQMYVNAVEILVCSYENTLHQSCQHYIYDIMLNIYSTKLVPKHPIIITFIIYFR